MSHSDYVFAPAPQVAVPVVGTDKVFPVRRVYCIGRNYAAHAIEMGYDPEREDPFFFQKNPDNLNLSGQFEYPSKTTDVHHEIEMAVMLQSGGRDIPVEQALDHVYGYALALDMTRRDLQGQQKKMGRPWEIGKAFEGSAPIGPVHLSKDIGHLSEGRISLHVNEDLRQDADLNQMIWKVEEQISYLSAYFELAAGDVIFSGTPAGVGPVQRGDHMTLEIEKLGKMTVTIV